jgi:hypothetical protein
VAASKGKAAFRIVCLDVRKAATDRANLVQSAASRRPFYEVHTTQALLADTRSEHRNTVDLHNEYRHNNLSAHRGYFYLRQ